MTGLPDGYARVSIPSGWAVVRSDWKEFLVNLAAKGSVVRATSRRPDAETLQGRGELFVSRDPEGRAFVARRLRHGGLLAPLTGERFWPTSVPRPLNELLVSVRLAGSDIATPAVLAACVYTGRWGYTGEVMREFLADARDLADVLFDPASGADERTRLLSATSDLIRDVASCGVYHPDMNLRNLLVRPQVAPGGVWILDLEKCSSSGIHAGSAWRMAQRLLRSARKLCRQRRAVWHQDEWAAFEMGLRDLG